MSWSLELPILSAKQLFWESHRPQLIEFVEDKFMFTCNCRVNRRFFGGFNGENLRP
jgi:hypothetical protein